MSDDKPAAPYTRLALPTEFHTLAQLGAKSFINDPLLSWSANRKATSSSDEIEAEAKNLQIFHESFMRAVFAVGGRIVVVAVPGVDGERIVAVSEWLLPNQSLSGVFNLRNKRMDTEYRPTVIKHKNAALEARGHSLKEGAYDLELIFTDPDEGGKGYCGMLLAEAEAAFEAQSSTSELLFTLEATTPQSQAVYTRWGWELMETLTFGTGTVNASGIPASGSDACGLPIALMSKRKSKKS